MHHPHSDCIIYESTPLTCTLCLLHSVATPQTNGSQPATASMKAKPGRQTPQRVIDKIRECADLTAPEISKMLVRVKLCTKENVPSYSTIYKYRSEGGAQRSTGRRTQVF